MSTAVLGAPARLATPERLLPALGLLLLALVGAGLLVHRPGALSIGSGWRVRVFVELLAVASLVYFLACAVVLRRPGAHDLAGAGRGAGDAPAAAAGAAVPVQRPLPLCLGWPRAAGRHQPLPLHPGRSGAGPPARPGDLPARQPPRIRAHDLSADGAAGVPRRGGDRADAARHQDGHGRLRARWGSPASGASRCWPACRRRAC